MAERPSKNQRQDQKPNRNERARQEEAKPAQPRRKGSQMPHSDEPR